MASFEELIKEKSKKLSSVPLALQTSFEKQQAKVLEEIILLTNDLDIKNGEILINKNNLDLISKIDSDLKKVFLNDEYLASVKKFAGEFDKQALLNNKVISKEFGAITDVAVSSAYIALARKSAVSALIGAPIDTEFIKPVQSILENAVVNGASLKETIGSLKTFIQGDKENNSKLLRYVKQISNDSFAIADASYTSIVSDYLDADWFYYSGGEVDTTRCFCQERVGNYYYYKTIEAWGNGEDLGDCNIGGGEWAGMIAGTNSKTIWSYRGGWNCGHFFMPVSKASVPDSDLEREASKWNIN